MGTNLALSRGECQIYREFGGCQDPSQLSSQHVFSWDPGLDALILHEELYYAPSGAQLKACWDDSGDYLRGFVDQKFVICYCYIGYNTIPSEWINTKECVSCIQ